MIKELHIAAQYLTAAAISFIDKKADDSHTNLAWSAETSSLSSRVLNDSGIVISLNLNNFTLEWSDNASFPLANKSHQEILSWIISKVKRAGFSTDYRYDFHYETGYDVEMDQYIFPEADQEDLATISNLFSIAQNAMTAVLDQQNLESEIRVWSHHFDMGAFAVVNKKLAIGLGLAIPDSKINDFYFYVSGYQGHNSIETKGFAPLHHGDWQTGEWKAATLKAGEISENDAISFLNEAVSPYRS